MSKPTRHPASQDFLDALRSSMGPEDVHVGFDVFMRCALYHPRVGYYARQRERIGHRSGTDFYTSSSLGGVFAELVLDAIRSLLPADPADFCFVEIGAEDPGGVLGQPREHPFRERRTVRRGEALNLDRPAVVFSNELFDAQPFRRFVRTSDSWQELGVRPGKSYLEWTVFTPVDSPPPLPADVPVGYIVDWPGEAGRLLREIVDTPWTGLFIAFDYGLPRETILHHRPVGTARTYSRHRQGDDLLASPGEMDLTCHVVWEELQEILEGDGFQSVCLESQEAFFMHHAAGAIGKIVTSEKPGLSARKQTLMQLLHPDNMGHKFQALHATRGLV